LPAEPFDAHLHQGLAAGEVIVGSRKKALDQLDAALSDTLLEFGHSLRLELQESP